MWVAACIGGAGVLTYGYLALVARAIPGDGYSAFGAFWSMALIVGFGVFLPVELELARSMSSHPAARIPPRIGRTLVVLVIGCLVVGAVAAPLVVPALGGAASLVPLVALVAVSSGQFLLRGLLLGRARLVTHGTLLLVDSGLRVVLALLVGALLPEPSPAAYAWTTVLAAALAHVPVLVVVLRRGRRIPTPSAGPVDAVTGPPGVGVAVGHLLVGTLSAQVLLNASPVLVAAVASGPELTTSAAYAACFTLVRLPLFVAVPLQSALVPAIVRAAQRGGPQAVRTLVLRVLAGTAVLGVGGWGLGTVAGPALVGLFFGAGYELSGTVIGILAGGAGLHVGLLVLSQVLVASALHRQVAVVWSAGVVAGLVLFLAVPDLVLRAAWAFTTGTAVALAVSAVILVTGGRRVRGAERN